MFWRSAAQGAVDLRPRPDLLALGGNVLDRVVDVREAAKGSADPGRVTIL